MNAPNSPEERKEARRRQQSLLREVARQKDGEVKRRILNRILLLDPANASARDLLLELDQAEIRRYQAMGRPYQSASTPAFTFPLEGSPQTLLVLKYPLLHWALIIGLMAISAWLCLASMDHPLALLMLGAVFVALLLTLWNVSTVVEVSQAGFRCTRLFGIYRKEFAWAQIAVIKPSKPGQGLTLSTDRGISIRISARMRGYSALMETLPQIRADLFHLPVEDVNSMSRANKL